MTECHVKRKLVKAISRDLEALLEKEIGEKFALLEIVKRDGEVVFLRSNEIESTVINDKSVIPTKRILVSEVQNESIISFTGSPRCRMRIRNGRGSMTNLTPGGSVDDCYD